MERKVIKASDGMVLTNGSIYGKTIYLADGMNESDFHEIPKEEYDRILESEADVTADYENNTEIM